MSAVEVMGAALLDLSDREQRPPCGDRTGRWTSEDRGERRWVARHCAGCQLLDE